MNEIQEQIQRCEAFWSLIPSQLEQLAEQSELSTVTEENLIFRPGDEADSVYVLASGSVQISHYEKNGRKAILQTVWPGELFGQCALVAPVAREASCEVTSNASVVIIPTGPLRELMLVNPRLTHDLMLNVGGIMRSLAFRMSSILLRPKRQRLLDLLRSMARCHGVPVKDGVMIPIPFSHQQLSEMIGASRETVTVVLGRLKNEGVLTSISRQIVLKDQNVFRASDVC